MLGCIADDKRKFGEARSLFGLQFFWSTVQMRFVSSVLRKIISLRHPSTSPDLERIVMFAHYFIALTLVALLYPVWLIVLTLVDILTYGIDPRARRLGKVREVLRYFKYHLGLREQHPISRRGKFSRQHEKSCTRNVLKRPPTALAWPLTLVTTVDPVTNKLVRKPFRPDEYLD